MARQYLVIIISLVVVISIVASIPNTSNIFKLLTIINAGIATLYLFTYQDRPYSLHKITNLFILFFFVVANAIQFSSRENVTTFPMTLCADSVADYERFQFLILCMLVVFNGLYPIFKEKSPFVGKPIIIEGTKPQLSSKRLVILSLFSLLSTVFYYKNAFLLMFVRGLAENQEGGEVANLGEGNIGSLLFEKIIRAFSFSCFILSAHYKSPKKVQMLLLLILLITLFPTGLARNAAAMYWMPVFFLMFSFLERKNFFILCMLIGLFVVFPFLENFRYWSGELSSLGLSFDFFNEMHFDASQNFMILLKLNIITWGRQLLGALLFWFPRSIWSTKPIGSGAFMAEDYSDFTNISMPFFAEGYINFGYMGVFLFTFILSWFCSYFDSLYWRKRHSFATFTPYYLLLISSLLFVLRGDLMSSTAYTLATLFDIYFVFRIVNINKVRSAD